MTKDENYLYGKPQQEIDEPLDIKMNVEDDLTTIALKEKEKERREKRDFSAFKLIIGCLVFLGLVFVIDTVASIAFGITSETTNSIIEIVKTLLFTLSGYLFARKENGD